MTTDEWMERIAPHLSTSLERVSEAIMHTNAAQSWLRRAAAEAAEGLARRPGLQAEMQGYAHMKDDLEETLPNLVAAVEALTEGCGEVDLKWQPHQPKRSRLYVSFDRDYSVAVFCRSADCTPEAVREALSAVVDALPEGEPFPNRPNEVTGLVARNGTAVGVRVREHLRKDGTGTTRRLTLLPPDRNDRESLSGSEAARELLRLLCSTPEA